MSHPARQRLERIARLISEQDREDAGEAPDFAGWHWEERASVAAKIINDLANELAEAGHSSAATFLVGQNAE